MSRPLIVSFLLLFITAAIPPIDFAARDARMLQTYSLDEAAFVSQVHELFDAGTLEVKGFTYGALYPYLGIALASICSLVTPITDWVIIVILRIISIGAALVTAGYTFLIARNLYDLRTGHLAMAFVLSAPIVFKWSVEIHPDLLQLSFLTASLHFATSLARGLSYRLVSLSALFAGLAVGTKYGGVFLIPTILLAMLLGIPGGIQEAFKDRRFWVGAVLATAVFLITFGFTNPYALLNISRLLEDLSFTRLIVSETEGNAFSWIQLLFSPGVGAVCGLGILATLGSIVRGEWLAKGGRACVLFWLCSYVGFLMGNVSFIAGQYLLPVVPAFSIVVAAFVVKLSARFRKPDIFSAVIAGAIVLLHIQFAAGTFGSRTRSESENPVIVAGKWIAGTYDTSTTTILYDTYAYIPSSFLMAETFFGLSYPVIHFLKPDLVITRKSIRERYANPGQSDHFRLTDDRSKQSDFLYLSPQQYRDIHYTYVYLETNISAYRLVRDFGDVTVYENSQPVEAGEKKKRWAQTVTAQRGQGVKTSLSAAAYSAFGHLHGQAENWEEAKVQYGKAVHLSKDDILSRYDYALALAHQDSFDLAEKHIDQISNQITDPANPWLKLGWDLYVMGVFERSRKASLTAHAHQPTHPFALYNVALTYLAEEKAFEADSAYTVALQNNVLPPETATLLGKMIADGSLQGESLAVANRVIKKGDR